MPVGEQVIVRHRNGSEVGKAGESKSWTGFYATISAINRIHLKTSIWREMQPKVVFRKTALVIV